MTLSDSNYCLTQEAAVGRIIQWLSADITFINEIICSCLSDQKLLTFAELIKQITDFWTVAAFLERTTEIEKLDHLYSISSSDNNQQQLSIVYLLIWIIIYKFEFSEHSGCWINYQLGIWITLFIWPPVSVPGCYSFWLASELQLNGCCAHWTAQWCWFNSIERLWRG